MRIRIKKSKFHKSENKLRETFEGHSKKKNTGLWEQPSYRASNYKVFQINTTIYLSNAFVFNPFSDFCHQNKVIFLISIALFTLKSENKSRITSASPNPAAILRFWFSARLTWQSRDSRDGRHMIMMLVTCLWQTEIIRLSLDQSF